MRPVVVQTDFAGDDGPSALPLVLGGALMVGARCGRHGSRPQQLAPTLKVVPTSAPTPRRRRVALAVGASLALALLGACAADPAPPPVRATPSAARA